MYSYRNTSEFCRLCTTETSPASRVDIFKEEGRKLNLLSKITNCLPVIVTKQDDLPKRVCNKCVKTLEKFHKFREMSLRSESSFLQNNSNSEFIAMDIKEEYVSPDIIVTDGPSFDGEYVADDGSQHSQNRTQWTGSSNVVDDVSLGQELTHKLVVPDKSNSLNQSNTKARFDSVHRQNTLLQQSPSLCVPANIQTRQTTRILNTNRAPAEAIPSKTKILVVTPAQKQSLIQMLSTKLGKINSRSSLLPTSINQNVNLTPENKLNPGPSILLQNNCKESNQFNDKTIINADQIKTEPIDSSLTSEDISPNEQLNPPIKTVRLLQPSKFRTKFTASIPMPPSTLFSFIKASESNEPHPLIVPKETSPDTKHLEHNKTPQQKGNKSSTSYSLLKRKAPIETNPTTSSTETSNKYFYTEYQANNSASNTNNKVLSIYVEDRLGGDSCINESKHKSGNEEHLLKNQLHENTPYPSLDCKDESVVNESNLESVNQHIKNLEKLLKFVCSYCGKAFRNRASCAYHVKKYHLKIFPFSCSQCEKQYVFKKDLIVHFKNNHKRIKQYYKCEFCNKNYQRKANLRKHLQRQCNIQRTFNCDVCGRSLATETTLRIHKLTHRNVSYECDICKKRIKTKGGLQMHLLIHSGVKKFVCEFCGKAFALMNVLKTHRNTHTGERPYQCNICDKTFTQKSSLNTHRKCMHSARDK